MTNIKTEDQTAGTVFNINSLLALPQDDCNVLLVSSRTLSLIQLFGRGEVGFVARYANELLPGGRYVVADTPTNQDDIATIKNRYELEVIDVSCDIVGAINEIALILGAAQNSCGCDIGQGSDNENGEDGGDVPSSIGNIIYEEPSAAPTRDCKASNLIHETLLNIFTELNAYNVDDMSVLGLALVVGIVAGVIASAVATPLAGVIVAVAGITATFAARLIGFTVSLGDIAASMSSVEESLVCALFNATTAGGAKSAYLAVLTSDGLTSSETALVGVLMTNALMNIRFFDTDETSSFWATYTAPVSCVGCDFDLFWSFSTGLQGWTYTDQSVLGGSGDTTWQASTQALRGTFNIPIVDHASGSVDNESPAISLAAVGSTRVTINYGAPSDAINTGVIAILVFDTEPNEEFEVVYDEAGQYQHTFTTTDELVQIIVNVNRFQGGSAVEEFDFTADVLDVGIELL